MLITGNLYQVVLFLALLALSLCFIAVPSAFAQQHFPSPTSKGRPNAEGGGCSQPPVSNSRNDIQNLQACISYVFPNLKPDAYVTFRPLSGHGGISSCSITIYVQNFDSGNYAGQKSYNCVNDAINRATHKHYGPFDVGALLGTFFDFAVVSMTYSDGTSSDLDSTDSPVVTL